MNDEFHTLLNRAVEFHGHLCGGQVLGVRMASAGLRELGITDPRGREGRDLVIFIEIDRCAADAIIAVTGRTPGRRSIKLMDYGKMAATFVDLAADRAVRISARGDSERKVEQIAATLFPAMSEKEATIAALKEIVESDLLRIQEVEVDVLPQNRPGRPLASTTCRNCGEIVKDMREVVRQGKTLCRPCALGSRYYTEKSPSPMLQERADPGDGTTPVNTGPAIDWNQVWCNIQSEKHRPMRDPGFWDKRAPEFTRHATSSDYIGQFIQIMNPQPQWSILDVGCAAGTLAIPLAPSVKSVTALDASPVMISLLKQRCQTEGIDNILAINGKWEDNWEEHGIGMYDVAVASRSLIIDDLQEAILKLQRHARKRVYLSTLVDTGPYDSRILGAVGRNFTPGADYILVYNILRQMGIYANVAFTVNKEQKTYDSVEDAVEAMRWMIYEMTADEENLLREHLTAGLVKENGHWRLPYQRVVRWAVLWWDREHNSDDGRTQSPALQGCNHQI